MYTVCNRNGRQFFLKKKSDYLKVTGISDIVQIAAGEKHNLALTSEGKVYAWGMNTSGQLGDGTTTGRYSPTEIPDFIGVKSIAVGGEGSWAVKEDGTVWHWGKGYSGTNYPTSSTPTQIAGLTNFAAVYAGGAGVLGIKENGDVWIFYAVGISQPTQLPGIDGIAEVSFGEQFAIARKDDGTVWAMGFNNMGQLGDGTTATRDTAPVQTKNLANVADISAGYWHSLAITADGKVWGWGSGKSDQLGEFDEPYSTVPIQIAGKINNIAEPLPADTPPPNRETGIEYEQNTSSYTDLTPPSINAVHVEVLNFFKGIYRLTITDEDYSLDSRGTPFFFWSAEEGTFSEESADYKSVVFTADPGTAGRKVRVTVGIGDGLGQVSYRSLSLDGSEQQ